MFRSPHLKRFCNECGNITHIQNKIYRGISYSTFINTVMGLSCVIGLLILTIASRLL